jgi:hypothetical protein
MCDVIVLIAKHAKFISVVNIFILHFSAEVTVNLYSKKLGNICTLLGHYTALSGNSAPTFRDDLSAPSSVKKCDR